MSKTFKLRKSSTGFDILENGKRVAHRKDFISAGACALLRKYKSDEAEASKLRRKRVRDLEVLAEGGELKEAI